MKLRHAKNAERIAKEIRDAEEEFKKRLQGCGDDYKAKYYVAMSMLRDEITVRARFIRLARAIRKRRTRQRTRSR